MQRTHDVQAHDRSSCQTRSTDGGTVLRFAATTLACAVMLAATLAGCAPAFPKVVTTSKPAARATYRIATSSWPCAQHDAQRTSRTTAVVPNTPPASRWSLGQASDSEPAIGRTGTLFMSVPDSGLWAIDGGTGRVIWKTGIESDFVAAAFENGDVVVSSAVGVLLGQQAVVTMVDSSGRKIWQSRIGKPAMRSDGGSLVVGSPTIAADGTIYVVVSNQGVFALDPVDGHVLWTFASIHDLADPTIGQDGTIYELEDSVGLAALKPDGSLRWRVKSDAWFATPPVVGPDGTIYLQEPSALRAVAPDGRDRWQLKLDVQGALGIGRDGTIYAPDPGNRLSAVSPKGKVRWVVMHGSHAALVDGKGRVVIQDGSSLYVFRADGSELWHKVVGEETSAMPVVGPDGTVYVGDGTTPASLNAWGGVRK
jgi:outer membrane protein assembly factor BamB